jgi:hypothetical protein
MRSAVCQPRLVIKKHHRKDLPADFKGWGKDGSINMLRSHVLDHIVEESISSKIFSK